MTTEHTAEHLDLAEAVLRPEGPHLRLSHDDQEQTSRVAQALADAEARGATRAATTSRASMARDLAAELTQVRALGDRLAEHLTGTEAVAAAVEDALRLIDRHGCEHFTRRSGRRCSDTSSGKTRGARYSADAWCHPCIADDALVTLGDWLP